MAVALPGLNGGMATTLSPSTSHHNDKTKIRGRKIYRKNILVKFFFGKTLIDFDDVDFGKV